MNYADCPVCWAKDVPVHKDGTLFAHGKYDEKVSGHAIWCPGSDTKLAQNNRLTVTASCGIIPIRSKGAETVQIFTFGYQKQSPERLKRVAERLNAKVIDIRFSPLPTYTNNKWSKKQLEITLCERYEWLQAFGNRNYKNGGEIEILNTPAGCARIAELMQEYGEATDMRWIENALVIESQRRWDALILLCACEHLGGCHRKIVRNIVISCLPELDYAGELIHTDAWRDAAEQTNQPNLI